ncbi:uncharacterized protein MELLADRAFT_109503 [Melampsora larici-populina 98AG31]|uniref:Uncharacterized protein n=1 Tax=Melampsora larici-populina (strain 98AG31 / pathotype 3-4-7) TaxID=747676 RepID=F4RWP3_MELLP|nr:uncharacterized protein MELLADRAFT_109503 [Melampsora larici-populina 98AG31]EGG03194.1 hypothetical protein MELLADRAFT_109503 [Melampsora larici-populina 98AG31]
MTTRNQKKTNEGATSENGSIVNMLTNPNDPANVKTIPPCLNNTNDPAQAKDITKDGDGDANPNSPANTKDTGGGGVRIVPEKLVLTSYLETLGIKTHKSVKAKRDFSSIEEDEQPFVENGVTFMPGYVPSVTTSLLTPYFDKNIKEFKGPMPLSIFNLNWQALADSYHAEKKVKTNDVKQTNYTGYPYPDDLTLTYGAWCINYRNFLKTFANPYRWHRMESPYSKGGEREGWNPRNGEPKHQNQKQPHQTFKSAINSFNTSFASTSSSGRGGHVARGGGRGGRSGCRGPPELFDPHFAEKEAAAVAATKAKNLTSVTTSCNSNMCND